MTFGVTDNGFRLKRLSDIAEESRQDLIAEFGPQINLDSRSPLGQIKGIYDERLSLLWEAMQAVYDSAYPQTAEGISLDNVASITGIARLKATKSSVVCRVFGDLGSIVPIGFTASVSGSLTSRFLSIQEETIHSGINEVQDLDFSAVPTTGSFRLRFDGQETAAINWDDTSTDIQVELNGLSNLSAVAVSGNFTAGFTVTFSGADGEKDQPLLEVFSNTLSNGSPVTTTVVETTKGYLPFVDVAMLGEDPGAIQAPSGSIIVIETPSGGIDSITNLLDAVIGQNIETDAELKQRRIETLQRVGSATLNGIRAKILTVENTVQAIIIENDQAIEVDGRPPKSFESFVLGGDDQEIAQSIFESKPAGIEAFGTVTETVVDSEGNSHSISFSRPVELDIYLIVNIDKNTNPSEGPIYPITGDTDIEEKILNFVLGLRIGQDVVVNRLYTPINEVAGVIGVEILIGTAPAPTLSDNIIVDEDEIAVFDSSRITVVS